ncbi:MAG: AMP nucleosidase, partial [Alphaproteobacteria bacterium]|nr:AMP nucleosidase [Alphaproteobacteria bacterium]
MTIISPPRLDTKSFTEPAEAWGYLAEIYHRNTGFIRSHLASLAKGIVPPGQVRACYPQIEVRSTSYSRSESTLPYGFLHTPGIYRTTVTAPDLFRNYFQDQFAVILKNHGGTIDIGESDTPIPLHFAVPANERIDGEALNALNIPLRDVFDAPDLGNT